MFFLLLPVFGGVFLFFLGVVLLLASYCLACVICLGSLEESVSLRLWIKFNPPTHTLSTTPRLPNTSSHFSIHSHTHSLSYYTHTNFRDEEMMDDCARACDSSNDIIKELEENINILISEVETQRKNKLPITSNKYLIAKNMEIDDEIINEYLTKLPEEILTMLNDLEPLFDKIKKYSSSSQKNFE